jgi:hypothetical protein
MSAGVRLRRGTSEYELPFDETHVAIQGPLGYHYNEVVTSSTAGMAARQWPQNWLGTSRTLQWSFRGENKIVPNASSTTFTVPATATHTLNEPVTCTWTEYTTQGQVLWSAQGTQPMRVFFERTAANDPDGGETSGVAWSNWFYHYAEDHMGAVDGYWASTTHYQDYTTVTWQYGGTSGPCYTSGNTTGTVATVILTEPYVVGDMQHSWPMTTQTLSWLTYTDYMRSTTTLTTFRIPPLEVDYATTHGVDTMEWVVAHENVHVRQYGNWHWPTGSWYNTYGEYASGVVGKDYDGDLLPDLYEETISLNWQTQDTWTSFYHRSGTNSDIELEAEREAQHHTHAHHDSDFGRPGCNSVPPD